MSMLYNRFANVIESIYFLNLEWSNFPKALVWAKIVISRYSLSRLWKVDLKYCAKNTGTGEGEPPMTGCIWAEPGWSTHKDSYKRDSWTTWEVRTRRALRPWKKSFSDQRKSFSSFFLFLQFVAVFEVLAYYIVLSNSVQFDVLN